MEKGVTDITDIVFSETNDEKKEEEEEEKNSGGIINSLISNLVAPKVRDGDDSTSAEPKNGGVFNTLISGILHQTGSCGDEREGTAAGDEREGTAAGDGGGGLLDNIVSHLHTPLADDAAPATDEASILIHSLVHD